MQAKQIKKTMDQKENKNGVSPTSLVTSQSNNNTRRMVDLTENNTTIHHIIKISFSFGTLGMILKRNKEMGTPNILVSTLNEVFFA